MTLTERMSSRPCGLIASLILHAAPQRRKGSTSASAQKTDFANDRSLRTGHTHAESSRLESRTPASSTIVKSAHESMLAACSRASKAADYPRRWPLRKSRREYPNAKPGR
jgi:hypothetical protein